MSDAYSVDGLITLARSLANQLNAVLDQLHEHNIKCYGVREESGEFRGPGYIREDERVALLLKFGRQPRQESVA